MLRVFSLVISNMADNGSFSPCLRLYIPQLICVNRRRRLVMQVALNYVLARRRLLLGVSLVLLLLLWARSIKRVPRFRLRFCRRLSRNTEHFMENGLAHFKHVYLVGEKEIELHMASVSAISPPPPPPNRAWHLGRKVELWVKHNLKEFIKIYAFDSAYVKFDV